MLTSDQASKIKVQLLQHIEKGFPEDKKEFAKKQVEEMNSEQLEEFLKQNNLAVSQGQAQPSLGGRCIFCSIVSGEIPSYKIAENSEAIAVLEINPLSRGHVLIIPKKHVDSNEKISKEAMKLAEDISKKIKSLLKPEEVTIKNSNMFGHEILNVLPLYKENLNPDKKSERYQATEEELLSLQKLFSEKPKTKKSSKSRTKKIKKSEKIILPRRIP